MSVFREKVLPTLGAVVFVVAIPLAVIGAAWYFSDPHKQLRKGLKEKNGIEAKSFHLTAGAGGVEFGHVVTADGDELPIAVHVEDKPDFAGSRSRTLTTQWIVGKRRNEAEAEIRALAEKVGGPVETLDLRPNPAGVAMVGSFVAKSGEEYDVTEKFSGPPLASQVFARMKPSSYPKWIRNSLEADLKGQVAGMTELMWQEKSWAAEEAERKAREAEVSRRLKKENYEARLAEVRRRTGREPTLSDILAAKALSGYEPFGDLGKPMQDEALRAFLDAQRPGSAPPPPKSEFRTATATMKDGRIYEVELEVKGGDGGLYLKWRDGGPKPKAPEN